MLCVAVGRLDYAYTIREKSESGMWCGRSIGLRLYDKREDRVVRGAVGRLDYAYKIREKTESGMCCGRSIGLGLYDKRKDRDWHVVGSGDWAKLIR